MTAKTESKQQGSAIEWTDDTWEVTAGCTKVSAGCKHCYAETLVGTRLAGMARKRRDAGTANGSGIDISLEVVSNGRWNNRVRLLDMNLDQPLKRKKPTRYFVNSRSDLFHPDVPFGFVDRVFAVMALCPRHRFMVLTKRPERMRQYVTSSSDSVDDLAVQYTDYAKHFGSSMPWPLPNIWLGTSVEDQATADARLPELLACPAAGRFVSAEPLLGAVDLLEYLGTEGAVITAAEAHEEKHRPPGEDDSYIGEHHCGEMETDDGVVDGRFCYGCDWLLDWSGPQIHWVIVGGESGKGARPCSVAWVRSIKEQCQHAGVPVFVKQLGADIRDRDDAGFEGDPGDAWDLGRGSDVEHDPDGDTTVYQGKLLRVRLKHKKGADPAEWPADLRVREMPEGLRVGSEVRPWP